MEQGKAWSKDDTKFLLENWGEKTIKTIGKMLERSEQSIVSKSIRLGLSKLSYYSEDISFNELCVGIGQANNYGYYKEKLKETDFPFSYKKKSSTRSKKMLMVNIDQFWKWIEVNQHQIDFSNFEKGMLGEEPSWAEMKRNNDIKKKKRVLTSPWSNADDTRLIDMVNAYKYSYKEVEEKLLRSHGAIVRRLNDLGIKGRPLRESSHSKWSSKQLKILKEMIIERKSYCFIAEAIGKSEKAIRGKVYTLYGSENIDKAANKIKFINHSKQEG